MTPEQVWKYVEEKAKRPIIGEYMQRYLNSMNYYKDKGFTFTCKDGTMIASKEGEEDYFFEFGSLQEDIERRRI